MDEVRVTLGKTDIRISPIGLGTMQWGDIKLPGSPGGVVDPLVHDIYQATLDAGINFFDTAEMYGTGRSELHLGNCLREHPDNIIVATKFMPFPWRLGKGELRKALQNSLNRLGLSHVDLYQMHWPFPPVPIRSWMDAMADVAADGLIRAVGVSNYSPNQTRVAFEALAKRNIPLASNQVKYSLLDRRPERSGLAELCNRLGVTIIAYSPLEKGILTGKYTPDNIPSGFRAWRYNKALLIRIRPLIDKLNEIGSAHGGLSTSKVALNWLVCKGAIPIPGARTKQQAIENAGGLGWHLSAEEVNLLDNISAKVIAQ